MSLRMRTMMLMMMNDDSQPFWSSIPDRQYDELELVRESSVQQYEPSSGSKAPNFEPKLQQTL